MCNVDKKNLDIKRIEIIFSFLILFLVVNGYDNLLNLLFFD